MANKQARARKIRLLSFWPLLLLCTAAGIFAYFVALATEAQSNTASLILQLLIAGVPTAIILWLQVRMLNTVRRTRQLAKTAPLPLEKPKPKPLRTVLLFLVFVVFVIIPMILTLQLRSTSEMPTQALMLGELVVLIRQDAVTTVRQVSASELHVQVDNGEWYRIYTFGGGDVREELRELGVSEEQLAQVSWEQSQDSASQNQALVLILACTPTIAIIGILAYLYIQIQKNSPKPPSTTISEHSSGSG